MCEETEEIVGIESNAAGTSAAKLRVELGGVAEVNGDHRHIWQSTLGLLRRACANIFSIEIAKGVTKGKARTAFLLRS